MISQNAFCQNQNQPVNSEASAPLLSIQCLLLSTCSVSFDSKRRRVIRIQMRKEHLHRFVCRAIRGTQLSRQNEWRHRCVKNEQNSVFFFLSLRALPVVTLQQSWARFSYSVLAQCPCPWISFSGHYKNICMTPVFSALRLCLMFWAVLWSMQPP